MSFLKYYHFFHIPPSVESIGKESVGRVRRVDLSTQGMAFPYLAQLKNDPGEHKVTV